MGKLFFVKEIVDRCPKDKKMIYKDKCDDCPYRGIRYEVDKPDRPYTVKTRCDYK